MTSAPAIVIAAAGVGFGHAVLPDHWLPLATVGRTQRFPLRKLARLSGLAGVAHVLVSVLLGAFVVVVGLGLRSKVQHAENAIVGGLLLATGIAVLLLAGRDRHAHAHPHRERGWLAIMVPFGAAASPDLTILPVFLAASAAGTVAAICSLVAFALVTVGTIVALTLLASAGAMHLTGRLIDRWGNALTAAVLVVIGGLVIAGVL